MIRLPQETLMNEALIKKILIKHQGEDVPRLKKMEDYYKGKTDILKRQMKNAAKPNNKIVNPFANYITTMFCGYFIGEPIAYTSEDTAALDTIKMSFAYNDEQDENAELAKDASIYGVGYEMLYVSQDGTLRFKRVSPLEVVYVYDDTVEEELLYALRYYKTKDILTDDESYTVEVYSRFDVKYYQADATMSHMKFLREQPHYFGLVPFAKYNNNEEEMGDFEKVVSLIDAYDKLASDTINNYEYFTDAYLVLTGATLDEEDIEMMTENRVMVLDQDATAQWLIKATDATNDELVKTRLTEDIHKFSECPSLTDKDFAANASGIAMKFKLMGMENVAAIKERKFKRGLQRRLELMANVLNLSSNGFDWRAIDITFTRNIPVNAIETADMIAKLKGTVSTESLLALLPFIEDPSKEVEKVNNEKEVNSLDFFQGGSANGTNEIAGADSGANLR